MEHLTELKDFKSECLISFGEYNGPVVAFWATLGKTKHFLAFEPDPMAFTALSRNFMALPYEIRKHSKIYNNCVDLKGEVVKVQAMGGSGSQIGPSGTFPVKCVPVKELWRLYSHCAWKMDIEGIENLLIDDFLSLKIYPPEFSFSVHRYRNSATLTADKWEAFDKKLEKYVSAYPYHKIVGCRDLGAEGDTSYLIEGKRCDCHERILKRI